MDCYFRQYWRDSRLSFRGLKMNSNQLHIDQLSLNVKMLGSVQIRQSSRGNCEKCFSHEPLNNSLELTNNKEAVQKVAILLLGIWTLY